MRQKLAKIGLIGDYSDEVAAHRAIPGALRAAGEVLGAPVSYEWIPTEEIRSAARVAPFDGLWCVPASPYRSLDGALCAIRYAREAGIPFLGTCGGFQHAVLEYARDVLDWSDSEHGETAPGAGRAVIAPLECSLVEVTARVRLTPGTHIARAYGALEAVEAYHCRYGLNPAFRAELLRGALRTSAEDEGGEVRAIELQGHPFFVGVLFQPERAALRNARAPLVEAFARACAARLADWEPV